MARLLSRQARSQTTFRLIPEQTYAETGWAGLGDWLGTGQVRWHLRQYRPFKKARAFVRSLGLKSEHEWDEYCKSGKKPADIPATPYHTYAETAGLAWAIGLGLAGRDPCQYRSFKKARAFVRSLGLKSRAEWNDYCKSGKKPDDIPANPNRIYAEAGWAGMGDWLGTGAIAPQLRPYRSFKKARAFVRSLGLKSLVEWDAYSKSGKKPADIPAKPQGHYADVGWAGTNDWIGTEVHPRLRKFRPFKIARAFVHKLHLKSTNEWRDYCRSGKKPHDIPTTPSKKYSKDGWAGMGDWLGTGAVANLLRQYRSFKKARAFVRRLGLNRVPNGSTIVSQQEA